MLERYKQEKLTIILNKKLNAHNQYLQTFLGLGIPGLLLLLSFLLVPFSLAWKKKKKNFPYMAFILIVLLNFLVESMLEARAGTNFIALFNCLFAYLINKPRKQAPSLRKFNLELFSNASFRLPSKNNQIVSPLPDI